MTSDSLGDRMKDYESVPRIGLLKKTPAIVRVDGKSFHTLTRGMERPYDRRLARCMWAVAQALCEHIHGAQMAFSQSDEVSVLITDDRTFDTEGWFGYQVQKMASVSASIATWAFGRAGAEENLSARGPGLFDARVFNLPRHEVVNYFIWRQQDGTRNSIESLGQAHFSARQLHGINCAQIQELLFSEKGINWNDTPTVFKRGAAFAKVQQEPTSGVVRSRWLMDEETPVFTRDRAYIERLLTPAEDL